MALPPPGAGFLSMTVDQSVQPCRSPQWGWEREGLGLTQLAGSPWAQALHAGCVWTIQPQGLLGAAALVLQAWGVLLSV